MPYTDILGKKFGKLTAVKKTDKRISDSVVWLFKCECGKLMEIPYRSIKTYYGNRCKCEKEITKRNSLEKRFNDIINFINDHQRLPRSNTIDPYERGIYYLIFNNNLAFDNNMRNLINKYKIDNKQMVVDFINKNKRLPRRHIEDPEENRLGGLYYEIIRNVKGKQSKVIKAINKLKKKYGIENTIKRPEYNKRKIINFIRNNERFPSSSMNHPKEKKLYGLIHSYRDDRNFTNKINKLKNKYGHNNRSHITKEMIEKIKEDRADGFKRRDLILKYNVSRASIDNILYY